MSKDQKKLKHSYSEMVQVALLTLNEPKGSSRMGIWKCVEAKFPESNYKQFLVRFKKLSEEGSHIEKVAAQRWKLEKKFRERCMRQMKKGETALNAIHAKVAMNPEKLAKKRMLKEAKKEKEKAAKALKRAKDKERRETKK